MPSNIKIMLSGGGSGGSVSPLLGMVDTLRSEMPRTEFDFLWLGTKFGPEKAMVEAEDIRFKAIQAGKFRRYFSIKNVFDIFFVLAGFAQSLMEIKKFKPRCLLTAGSFASVPAVWAAWILKIPVLVHQQDISPGLANRLMAPFASIITVVFEKSLSDYGSRAVWTGNPVRKFFIDADKNSVSSICHEFGLRNDLPILTIIGGGLGALPINKLIAEALSGLVSISQVVHITGKGKNFGLKADHNYYPIDFLPSDKIARLLSVSDLVVTRAGLNFLSELSNLSKPAIIIPMPDTHQEDNAGYYAGKQAAIYLDQRTLTSDIFIKTVGLILSNQSLRHQLGKKIKQIMKPNANQNIVFEIRKFLN